MQPFARFIVLIGEKGLTEEGRGRVIDSGRGSSFKYFAIYQSENILGLI